MSLTPREKPTGNRPDLSGSAQYLKGVGPERAKLLARYGLHTIEDILYYFPADYLDRRAIAPLSSLQPGQKVVVAGTIAGLRYRRLYRRGANSIVVVDLADDTGIRSVLFFNRPYLAKNLTEGMTLLVCGSVNDRGDLNATEHEILYDEEQDVLHMARIIPKYRNEEALGRRSFRALMKRTVEAHADALPEILPERARAKRRLLPVDQAIRAIHFPEEMKDAEEAGRRFAYQEFFLFQTILAMRKRKLKTESVALPLRIDNELDMRIRLRFPFKLTEAQGRAVDEIKRDLSSDRPMNRLLQGDVGSGKTIVAAYALLAAIGNRTQAAIMAPTEILAEQHERTFRSILAQSRVRICLLVGSLARKERNARLAKIAAGEYDLVVGTHALIQHEVSFKRLSVVVIDEQHKFGVLQRAALREKGRYPHLLVMTATPIPRTLSMTLYGDFDLSVIDELPPGRQTIISIFKPSSKLSDAFPFIRRKIAEGRQVFFVYPLIDDSDKLPLKSAKRMHKTLAEKFPDARVGLLHGAMAAEEKEKTMALYRDGTIRILVSTIVVEVGIDVPNATVMVVENGERYGLSQLHQLRGRIGRGAHESYFLLFGDPSSEEARRRIDAIIHISDGFKIAEEDLLIRGPGEFLGTAQSGFPEFAIADLRRHADLLAQAREDAFANIAGDPRLSRADNTFLRAKLYNNYRRLLDIAMT